MLEVSGRYSNITQVAGGRLMKCPYCGGKFEAEVELKPSIDDVDQHILFTIMRWCVGIKPTEGFVKRVEGQYHLYEFYLQWEVFPEEDTWVSGKAEWIPGHKFEVLEKQCISY